MTNKYVTMDPGSPSFLPPSVGAHFSGFSVLLLSFPSSHVSSFTPSAHCFVPLSLLVTG